MRDPYEVIIRPVLTEKSYRLATTQGKYTFQVHPKATKVDIRQAVERLFRVKVVKVNTLWVRGKARRWSRFQQGRTPSWKKAIVTLQKGQTIQEFGAL